MGKWLVTSQQAIGNVVPRVLIEMYATSTSEYKSSLATNLGVLEGICLSFVNKNCYLQAVSQDSDNIIRMH